MSTSDPDRLVRPYMVTRGRTRPAGDLPLEALVEARAGAGLRAAHRVTEARRILRKAASPCSIAELAVDLAVPIGVARVLVSDLAADGEVTIHRTAADGGPDVPLLERLLDGLSAC
ncbi:MAG: DUF742 domain-containing protein [Nitriliruptoraceae bacterium]|nr:DUF742 domain-containing protein [Nitriliruptoraceae bacterium]